MSRLSHLLKTVQSKIHFKIPLFLEYERFVQLSKNHFSFYFEEVLSEMTDILNQSKLPSDKKLVRKSNIRESLE